MKKDRRECRFCACRLPYAKGLPVLLYAAAPRFAIDTLFVITGGPFIRGWSNRRKKLTIFCHLDIWHRFEASYPAGQSIRRKDVS
jgi:hypothetical protein